MVGVLVIKLWLFGGNSNNGSHCGLAASNSNNAWSNSNANISARLTTLVGTLADNPNRMSVPRHGKTSADHEPRRQVRMYSLCSRNNIHLARIKVSLSACDVSNFHKEVERFTLKR